MNIVAYYPVSVKDRAPWRILVRDLFACNEQAFVTDLVTKMFSS